VNQPDEDFDDFDAKELTPDEYQKRMREICDGFSSNMYMSDMTKKESLIHFQKVVREKKEANQLLEPAVQKELFDEAKRLDIKDKAALILADLLFTENILDEIKKYKMLFLRFCLENKKAQKYLLGGYEKLVGDIYKEKLFANAVKILKLFYDEEILDEDVIIEWSLKESKKYVSKEMSKKIHEKVAPFIQWLKEAEVEDSDEEEEDEDDEADESDESSKKQQQQQQQSKQRKESVESDDVDIDFSYKATDGIKEQPTKSVVVMPVNADLAENAVISQDDIDIDNI
jgi:translation initiation factor 5